jgi:signal transduction histidine kinase
MIWKRIFWRCRRCCGGRCGDIDRAFRCRGIGAAARARFRAGIPRRADAGHGWFRTGGTDARQRTHAAHSLDLRHRRRARGAAAVPRATSREPSISSTSPSSRTFSRTRRRCFSALPPETAARGRAHRDRTETLRLNEMFSALLAHDLRSPLSAIIGSAQHPAAPQQRSSLGGHRRSHLWRAATGWRG